MPGLTRRKIELPLAALVAVLLVVLAGGLWAGNTAALGAKRMHEATGVAMLHNQDNWLTSFDTPLRVRQRGQRCRVGRAVRDLRRARPGSGVSARCSRPRPPT